MAWGPWTAGSGESQTLEVGGQGWEMEHADSNGSQSSFAVGKASRGLGMGSVEEAFAMQA